MIPVLSNVAGAAQAQRHNAFNQAKANEDAKAAAARAVRDRLMLGLVDAGVNAAMQFGGKAYDEATTGARDAQRLKSDLDQRERANVLDLAERDIDQLGYKTDPVPNAGYGMETETGKGRMERLGPDSGPSAAEGSPVTREMGPGPSAPGTLRAPTPDEAMGGLSPLQRAAQTTLLRNRQAAQDAATAAAERQRYVDAEARRTTDVKTILQTGGLSDKLAPRFNGKNGRPVDVPNFKPVLQLDQDGRPMPMLAPQAVKWTQPPMPGGGGASRASAEPYPGSEQIPVVAISHNKKGQPTALLRSLMNNVEWARQVVSHPDRFANVEADRPALARALRILDNPGASADDRANTLTEINRLAVKAIETHGGTVAWAGDTMTTSPADAARQAQADAERAAKATDDNAKRSGAIDLVVVEARQAVADIEAKAAAEMAKDVSGTKREAVAGLVGADIAAAMNGEPPRAGLTPDQVRAWQTMTARGAQIRSAKDAAIRLAKAKAAAKLKALGVDVEE